MCMTLYTPSVKLLLKHKTLVNKGLTFWVWATLCKVMRSPPEPVTVTMNFSWHLEFYSPWQLLSIKQCWEYPMEKGLPTHSSILAWRIPSTEETGGLHSMGSQGVTWLSLTQTTYWFQRYYVRLRGFPGGSIVKNSPVMQEMWTWSLGQEDPLE